MEAEPLIYPTMWGEDRVWDASRRPHALMLGGDRSQRRVCLQALAADAAGCGMRVVALAPGSAAWEWPSSLSVLISPEAMVGELERASVQMWDAYSHLLVCPLGWTGSRSLVVVEGPGRCLELIRECLGVAAGRAARETLAALLVGRQAAGFHVVVAADDETELELAGLACPSAHLAERLDWQAGVLPLARATTAESQENATSSLRVGKPPRWRLASRKGVPAPGLPFR